MPSTKKRTATKSQSERFIEAAREAGASEDEADFDRALKRIAKARIIPSSKPKASRHEG